MVQRRAMDLGYSCNSAMIDMLHKVTGTTPDDQKANGSMQSWVLIHPPSILNSDQIKNDWLVNFTSQSYL